VKVSGQFTVSAGGFNMRPSGTVPLFESRAGDRGLSRGRDDGWRCDVWLHRIHRSRRRAGDRGIRSSHKARPLRRTTIIRPVSPLPVTTPPPGSYGGPSCSSGSPCAMTIASSDQYVPDISRKVELAGGLLVFLGTLLVVRHFVRARSPV